LAATKMRPGGISKNRARDRWRARISARVFTRHRRRDVAAALAAALDKFTKIAGSLAAERLRASALAL
jgi:hypothetical protein